MCPEQFALISFNWSTQGKKKLEADQQKINSAHNCSSALINQKSREHFFKKEVCFINKPSVDITAAV